MATDYLKSIVRGVTQTETSRYDDAHIANCIQRAGKLAALVRSKHADPEWVNLSDEKKMDWFWLHDKEFQKEFPAVVVYMLYHNQYKGKAFANYLKLMNTPVPSPDKDQSADDEGELSAKEEWWCRRQSDYVKLLLYELKPYSDNKKNIAVAAEHAEQTYQSFKKDFVDFRKQYEDAKENVAMRKKKNKLELFDEFAERVTGDQALALSRESRRELIQRVRAVLAQQSMNKVIAEIGLRTPIPHSVEGVGASESGEHATLVKPMVFEIPADDQKT